MAKPILRRIDPRPGRRTLALSDIHGHSEMLAGALAAAGLTPADRLIVCGDLTEKGPDSLGTLRLLMGLSRRMEVHCLLGNCDQRALRALTGNPADPQAREALCRYIDSRKDWYGCLPAEMLRTLGLSPEDHDALAAVQQRFASEIAFLKEMPTVLIAPNYVVRFTRRCPAPMKANGSGIRKRNFSVWTPLRTAEGNLTNGWSAGTGPRHSTAASALAAIRWCGKNSASSPSTAAAC